jgi:hypothetical protein
MNSFTRRGVIEVWCSFGCPARCLRPRWCKRSVSADEAPNYLGGMAHFAQVNNPTSSARSRALLKWEPTHPGLLGDLADGHYFGDPASERTVPRLSSLRGAGAKDEPR